MAGYSIKELERLSGIRAHTIRIWEKRYQLIEPQRTSSRIRIYSDEDLKKIINVSLLNSHGIKISVIARMAAEELKARVLELGQLSRGMGIHIDALITSMLDFDEDSFRSGISVLEEKHGFEVVVTDLIYPFLDKIGILWQTGNITPAHEHFISNLVRQYIISAIAALPTASNARLRVVLFLPENELHEIALLFYHYIVRKAGLRTYYLGQTVPLTDLQAVYSVHRPHVLISSFTSNPPVNAIDDYIQRLCSTFPYCRILASGSLLRKAAFSFPSNFKKFDTPAELGDSLQSLK